MVPAKVTPTGTATIHPAPSPPGWVTASTTRGTWEVPMTKPSDPLNTEASLLRR